jgi:HPt (histidine-containing phosphotransfer) domain-containing protein
MGKPIDPDLLCRTLLRWIRGRSAPEGALARTLPAADAPPAVPLPGFDVPAALVRLGGKTALLHRLMLRLREGFADAAPRLRSALAAGEWDEAERLAHTLKGVAGTMEATDVAACAVDLDAKLRARDQEALPGAIDALEAALAVALASIATLEAQERESGIPPGGGGSALADAAAALREFDGLLRVRSLRARKVFAEVRPVLDAHEPACAQTIAAAIERLDFSAARAALGEVLLRCGISVEAPAS